jgi:hypothetical protein
MDLKLNIYKHGKIVKTYNSNTHFLPFFVCDEILNIVDVEALGQNINTYIKSPKDFNSKLGFGLTLYSMVQKLLPIIKPFLLDIFEGLTEDELKYADTKELISIIMEIVNFTVSGLFDVKTSKN